MVSGFFINNASLRAVAKQPLHMLIDDLRGVTVAQRLLRASQ